MNRKPFSFKGISGAFLFVVGFFGFCVLGLFGWKAIRNEQVQRFSQKAIAGEPIERLIREYGKPPHIFEVTETFLAANTNMYSEGDIPENCSKIYSFTFPFTYNGLTFCWVMTDDKDRILKSKLYYS